MDFQDTEIKEKQNSKLKTYISSFIADALVLSAVLYMISGQPKLKMFVANIALQCVKAIEAANIKHQEADCEFGIVKFLVLLNLVVVTLMALAKIRKSRIFKGQLFSNMVKIKLFIADTQSYVHYF